MKINKGQISIAPRGLYDEYIIITIYLSSVSHGYYCSMMFNNTDNIGKIKIYSKCKIDGFLEKETFLKYAECK